uniref:Peptidase S1 domain-containing protein n=1 Tax=Heliothis virescens TaxID=7102 RepID=A0A2A4IV93_HELVI
MTEKIWLFIQLIIIVFGGASGACDMAAAVLPEGLLGQTPDFMWLGLLQVHIRDFDRRHVAISGIVLIKPKYAIANADDVARIPERVFKQDTVAVFIRATNTPHAQSVLSYTVHPEYEDSTVHSLAIVELDTSDSEGIQLIPICLPTQRDKQSKKLYLTGYTDENDNLEKVIYQIRTLNNKVCDEYYERTWVSDKSSIPSASVCGYAPYSSINCQWDDGMALVSNATSGVFTLMGLSIHGPGCTAPAQYIDLYPYISWIQLVTGPEGESFAPTQPQRRVQPKYIPVHKLFSSNNTRRKGLEFSVYRHEFHPEQPESSLDHYIIEPLVPDGKTLAIYPFTDMFESYKKACSKRRVLNYHEDFQLEAPSESGEITYKVICEERTIATVSFREEIDFMSGTEDLEINNFEITKNVPYPARTEKPDKNKTSWIEPILSKPSFITADTIKGAILSNDLYIKFRFSGSARLTFKMFGSTLVRPTIRTTTTTTTTTTRTTTRPRPTTVTFDDFDSVVVRMYKEDSETLAADVQEPVSAGSHNALTPMTVAVACLLIALVSMRTASFTQ